MKATEIAFTAYAVNDLKRARAFYENVLGLTPSSVWEGDDMGFIEYEMGAHTLAIGKGAPNFIAGTSGATVALEVEDFDAAIASVQKHNVTFLLHPRETGTCHMALILDTEGNQIMLHKRKNK